MQDPFFLGAFQETLEDCFDLFGETGGKTGTPERTGDPSRPAQALFQLNLLGSCINASEFQVAPAQLSSFEKLKLRKHERKLHALGIVEYPDLRCQMHRKQTCTRPGKTTRRIEES